MPYPSSPYSLNLRTKSHTPGCLSDRNLRDLRDLQPRRYSYYKNRRINQDCGGCSLSLALCLHKAMVRLARLARARKVEEGRDEVKEGDEVQEEVGRGDRLHAPITMAEWRQPSPPSHAKMVQRRLISRTKYMAVAWVPMICLYLATRTSSLNERCIHAGAQTLAMHTRAFSLLATSLCSDYRPDVRAPV